MSNGGRGRVGVVVKNGWSAVCARVVRIETPCSCM